MKRNTKNIITHSHKPTGLKNELPSLKLTWHLKMDGWNTILSFWVPAYFQGRKTLVLGSVSVYLFIYLLGVLDDFMVLFLFSLTWVPRMSRSLEWEGASYPGEIQRVEPPRTARGGGYFFWLLPPVSVDNG